VSDVDESILEDYSKMVNELVDARREMSRLNDELKQKEEFLRNILQVAPSIIYAADISQEKIVFSNRPLSGELGFPSGEYCEETGVPLVLVHPEDREELEKFRQQHPADSVVEFHFRARRADGGEVWYRLKEKRVSSPKRPGQRIVVGSLDEITQLKLNEATLKSESLRDYLTGLFNRRGFLEAAGERIKTQAGEALVIFIDIDHFKQINDQLGHEVGDEVLKEFAKILAGSLRSGDIPARWGGDEFIALLSPSGPLSFEAVKTRLSAAIEDFNSRQTRAWRLGISIGHATLGEGSQRDLDGLIALADAQMYKSRREKRLA
jgi:diguanylate cyclase (GGDEF)-like protein/PAS domain S-box-containing protein